MHFRLIIVITLAAAFSQRIPAQSAGTLPPLESVLSPAQVRAAGLRKLSQSELDSLNSYIRAYFRVAAGRLDTQSPIAAGTSQSAAAVVESQIDGEFHGWDGETIFKLQNGQIWQQSSYAYTYHYAYGPKVLIYNSGGGYKMQVEGVDETISVRRLK